MMREVGQEFPADNLTWLQIYMFEFGFGHIERPTAWNSIVLDKSADAEGTSDSIVTKVSR